VAYPAVTRNDLGEGIKKNLPVGIGEKDLLASVASAGQMIDRPKTPHEAVESYSACIRSIVALQDLTLIAPISIQTIIDASDRAGYGVNDLCQLVPFVRGEEVKGRNSGGQAREIVRLKENAEADFRGRSYIWRKTEVKAQEQVHFR